MDRRDFLYLAGGSLVLPTAATAFDVDKFLGKIRAEENVTKEHEQKQVEQGLSTDERFLWMTRSASGEEFKESFYIDGKYNFDAYKRFCFIMRDLRDDGKVVAIDANLLNVLYRIQNTLLGFGFHKPLNINSGYRSLKTNENTEGAAKNSFHTKGRAVDISNGSMDSGLIGTLGMIMASGGVGFYPNKNFIHLDTGNRRQWVVDSKNNFKMLN